MKKFSYSFRDRKIQVSLQTDIIQLYFNVSDIFNVWDIFSFSVKGGLAYLFCLNMEALKYSKVEWYEKKRTGIYFDSCISIIRIGFYFTPFTFYKR